MNLASAVIDKRKSELLICDEIKVEIPIGELHSLQTKEVIVGIRPEHLQGALKDSSPDGKVLVKVKNVEVLGNETIFTFLLGENEWMAKWSGQWQITIGDEIPIILKYESLCLFDVTSNELIKKPSDMQNYVFSKEVLR